MSILRHRRKSLSSSISDDKLPKRIKYLNKRDLIHLVTIRGIVLNEPSIDDIIHALSKDINKKKSRDIRSDIYKSYHNKNLNKNIYNTIHKIKKRSIANELKKLRISNLIKKENILEEDLEEIKRLKSLSRNTLIKLAQLRNTETTGLKKSDIIHNLLRSQKHHN